jgi:hypothetical protein
MRLNGHSGLGLTGYGGEPGEHLLGDRYQGVELLGCTRD